MTTANGVLDAVAIGEIGGARATAVKVRAAAAMHYTNNPRVNGVMASPPTVAVLGTNPGSWGLTKGYTWLANPGVFRTEGGDLVSAGGGYRFRASTIAATGGNLGLNNGYQGTSWRVRVRTDAPLVGWRVGPGADKFRFLVDGQYVDTVGVNTVASSGSTNEYFSLDFGGVRKWRTITIEGMKQGTFVGVYVAPTDSVSQAPKKPVAVWIGDSLTEGATATHYADGVARVTADMLGCEMTPAGSGGTGWVAGPPTTYAFGTRIAGDVIARAPDLVFMQSSQNDNGLSTASVTANALAGMQQVRSGLPTALIVIVGAFPGITGPSAGVIAAEQAVMDAATAFADPFTIKVPLCTASPVLISGTRKPSQANGTTTSEIYMDDIDGAHLSALGHDFAGKWIADKVMSELALLAA